MTIADERYVIDVIINARDQMGDALREAVGHLSGLEKEADRASTTFREKLRKEVDKTRAAMGELAPEMEKIDRKIKETTDRFREMPTEMARVRDEHRNLQQSMRSTETRLIKVNELLEQQRDRLDRVKEGGRAYKDAERQVADYEAELVRLNKTLGDQKKTADEALDAEKEFGKAMRDSQKQIEKRDEVLKKSERALRDQTRAVEANAASIRKARDRLKSLRDEGADKSVIGDLERDLKRQERAFEQQFERFKQRAKEHITIQVDADTGQATREMLAVEAIKGFLRTDVHINMDMDAGAFLAKAPIIAAVKAELGRDVEVKVDIDRSIFSRLNQMSDAFNRSRHSIASFDNTARGLLVFAVTALMQSLLTVVVALAAELVALASSAILAGTALGGALVAGAAQAVPVISLLVTAFARVGAVIEAVKQEELARKQAFGDSQKADTQAADNANAVANALDSLRDAQLDLMRARAEAKDQLEDLILAEKEAALAAQQAVLSQEESQRALSRAVAEGRVFGTAEAQLGTRESALSVQSTSIDASRASRDLRRQQTGSPLRPDTSVEDAEKAVIRAQRALEEARKTAKTAGDDLTGAASNLQFFLSQLSDAERGLYDAIIRMKAVFEKNIKPITDNIIDSFTFAVKRTTQIMQDPGILKAANNLSESIADEMNKATSFLTSPRFVRFWETMMEESARNIEPITDQFLQLSDVFRRIALAARPTFRLIIRLIGNAIDDFDKFVGRGKSLNNFFEEAGKHFTGWWRLLRSVLRLFAALIGATADEGLNTVRSLTREINKAARWIRENSKEVQRFMNDVGTVMGVIGSFLLTLGGAILKAFDVRAAQALGDFLERVLIPALTATIIVLGRIFIFLEKITRNEIIAKVFQLAIAWSLVAKVLGAAGTLFAGFVGNLVRVGTAVGRLVTWFGRVTGIAPRVATALAPLAQIFGSVRLGLLAIGGPIAAIIGAFTFLAIKFGVMDDILDAFKRAGQSVVKAVKPAFEDLKDAVGRLSDAFSGDGDGLGKVLKFVFVTLVKGVVIPAIEILGKVIGETLGGAIDIVAGMLNVLADIFTGEWDKIPGHLKDVFDGLLRIVQAPMNAILGFIEDKMGPVGKILTAPFRLMQRIVSGLGDFFFDQFGRFIGVVTDLINGDFASAWQGIKDIIIAPFDLALGVIKDIVNFITQKLMNPVLEALNLGTIGPIGGDSSPDVKGGVGGRTKQKFAKGGGFISDAPSRLGTLSAFRNAQRFSLGGDVLRKVRGAGEGVLNTVSDAASGALDLVGGIFDVDGLPLPGVLEGIPGALADFVREFLGDKVLALAETALENIARSGSSPIGSNLLRLFTGLAGGGTVPGPASLAGQDVVPAWLSPGEFVVTSHGERLLEAITGVPGILSWLGSNQMPHGYATGGYVQRFAEGGRAEGGRKRAERPDVGDPSKLFNQIMSMLESFGDNAVQTWNQIWKRVTNRTQVGVDELDKMFRQMLKKSTKIFTDMKDVALNRTRVMVRGMTGAISDLQTVFYRGLSYIGTQTNNALDAFGVKDVDLSLTRPGADKKATGGFVGMAGERGRDTIATVLGRGEAVLNWGQQGLINALLPGQTTLQDILGRSGGYHAGGPEQPGFAGGYAGEKFPGGGRSVAIPGFPGEFINNKVLQEALYFIRKYKLFVTDAFATSGHSGPGHLVTGTAMDVVPGGGGGWESVNRAVAEAVRRGFTVLYDGQFGSTPYANHGEGHHAHIELAGGNVQGAIGAAQIRQPKVEGTDGPFKDLANASLEEVVKAARDYVGKKSIAAGAHSYEGGAMSEAAVRRIINQAMEIVEVPQGLRPQWMSMALERAWQESSFNPGVTNDWDSNAAAGDPSVGLFQTIGATFNAFKEKGMGVITNPLHNTVAAFNYMLSRYGQGDWQRALQNMLAQAGVGYAGGGIIGGQAGAAVPILAHGGEWVLNAFQQSKLAGLLGASSEQLKDYLGFSGGPVGFQGGGEVDLGRFFKQFAENFGREFRNLFGRDPSFQRRIYGPFASILGELRLSLSSFLSQLVGADVASAGGVRGRGGRGRRGTEDRAVREALDIFEAAEKIISRGNRLFKANKDGLDVAIRKFFEGITGDGGVLDAMTQAFDNLTNTMQTQLTRAITRVKRGGRRVVGRNLQPEEIIARELDDLRDQLRLLIGQKGAIAEALDQAKKALARARRQSDRDAAQQARAAINNLNARQREINQQIADQQLAVLDKIEERLASRVDEVNRDVEQRLSGYDSKTGRFGLQIRQGINEALGRLGRIPTLAENNINIMRQQQEDLQELLKKAERRGNDELARDIESQIADLQLSIVEAVAEQISFAEEEIQRAAERRGAAIDITNRVADIREGFGQTVQAQQVRGFALGAQRQDIQTQLVQYQRLLENALAKGFGPGVTDPLKDTIRDLTTQLGENMLATYLNTIAIRQASIDAITNRQSFLGGVSESLQGILETVGSITGQVNLPAIIALVQRGIDQLTITGSDLREQMATLVGQLGPLPSGASAILSTLEGLHGQEFVEAVSGLNLNEIINSLGGPDSPLSQQFQSLLQAIIDNEAALQQNTEQLQELQQDNNIQEFTSTAWQWFRQAIFTGTGGLLPRLAAGTPYYEAQSGGMMASDGPIYAHRGEIIIPPNFSQLLLRLMNAGVLAATIGEGTVNVPTGIELATHRAATMQVAGGGLTSNDYKELKDALLHQQQHIEVNVDRSEPAHDDEYLASKIAFKTKIPSS